MEQAEKQDNLDRLFVTLDKVEDEPKEYVYPPYYPRGKLTGKTGDPGVGKSKETYGEVALVTTGKPLLGIPCEASGNVLLFANEDDASDIKQTISASGGDLSRVFILSEQPDVLKDLSRAEITFGSPLVEEAIKRYQPVMVVFDPLQMYLGQNVDPNKAVQVTAALKPLLSLAKRYNFAAVVVQHNNKATDGSLQNRAAGSASIVGCYRSLISIVRDPEKPDENIAIHSKTNNRRGKSIRYKIESIPGNENFARVKFIGLEDYTERDYRGAEKRKAKWQHDSEINENDIVVGTIIRLMEENPSGIRICRTDLQSCAAAYFGEPVSLSLAAIEQEYGAYLLSRHGICIQAKASQQLRNFNVKGKSVMPSKQKDRCLHIYKRGTPVQLEL